MGLGAAIRTCFRKYITVSGRASRSEFWWFYLFLFPGGLVASVLDAALVSNPDEGGPVQGLFGLVTFVPWLTAAVRRLHDTGRPGYYIFAPFLFMFLGMSVVLLAPGSGALFALGGAVILLGFLVQLYWLIQKSDPGDNRYGPNPLTGERLDQVFE